MLTEDDFQRLTSSPKVRKIAVENFLGSLEGLSRAEALANLSMDSKMYRWNSETVLAIKKGISILFKK